MRRTLIYFAGFQIMSLASLFAADPVVLPVWPRLEKGTLEKEEQVVERGKDRQDRSIRNVKWPTLTVYLPPAEIATGAAVIICPGGGYGSLAIDKEGHDVARWLNTVGAAGIVLKYRLPKPELTKDEIPWPLQDAQQAIRMVRNRAAEWKIDPARIGIMGFSAGGHLAASASTQFDQGKPGAEDALEGLSCRPDFTVLVYPVVSLRENVGHSGSRGALLGKTPDSRLVEKYSNELHVNAETPPAYLAHAKDDGVKVENSILYHEALKKAGVRAELQLIEKGGHGFGLGIRGGEAATWPAKCAEWLKAQKILSKQ